MVPRGYEYIASTNDDGWLVGGGESFPYKLNSPDSAHVEIMRVGTFEKHLGGISISEIENLIQNGTILIPMMEIIPTDVICNSDIPPEIEVRFDLQMDLSQSVYKWPNWQIVFLHNQLFKHFNFPSRFCPGPHHMTFIRKATFRSNNAKDAYFNKCKKVIEKWKAMGPQLLLPEANSNRPGYICEPIDDELSNPGGIYLYLHRNKIIKYFRPNFLPPYDTPEKIEILNTFLSLKWNPETLNFETLDI